jgi:hypothetical protein
MMSRCKTCAEIKKELTLVRQYIELAPQAELDRLNVKALVDNILKKVAGKP